MCVFFVVGFFFGGEGGGWGGVCEGFASLFSALIILISSSCQPTAQTLWLLLYRYDLPTVGKRLFVCGHRLCFSPRDLYLSA